MVAGGPPSSASVGDRSLDSLLSLCLDEAKKAHDCLHQAPSGNDAHIAWLERQLSQLIAQLQAMLHDVESGFPLDAELWDQLDLEEMLEDSMAEIRNLKSLIQSLRAMGR